MVIGGDFRPAAAEIIAQALRRHQNNKARTAEEIGLSRQALFKILKKHKIGTAGVREDSPAD